MLLLNGKPFNQKDFEDSLNRAATASVAKHFRERLGSVRHPDTGEFPTIVIEGDSIDDMGIRVEGSTELLALVRERISPEETAMFSFKETAKMDAPRAFLSYGEADRDLAKTIAERLQGAGIDTWWAEWEIGAGDSIRRKIDSGLRNCTHFIVLLTESSLASTWVNEEMDAGFMLKVGNQCRFIPLRWKLRPEDLPPTLQGMSSPEIDERGNTLKQLVDDIHGINKKPPLGQAPVATTYPRTGYSPAATAIAKLFVDASEHAMYADVQLKAADVVQRAELSLEDTEDALHELRHYLEVHCRDTVLVKSSLYTEFDKYWRDWNPIDDALRLAADLVNDPEMPHTPAEIANRYKWSARRLNPAITYLKEREAVEVRTSLGSGPFVVTAIGANGATRRFVKSRTA
ncbi:toll/interleukin-1 receptor domain-containing protein [Cupriavidus plantarum]|uniref:toll/interleukin-1 receptor domain-containing protein n=1 Tax=Cupriavidus plantarum TaxID=942865 RepID=UPI000E26DF06|nr:toll/interleukin-1 receptor domain-containing protein [Cupriavidus plantarum]REF03032.1 TIR domain-containing protein [Cupriavidus plantarum]